MEWKYTTLCIVPWYVQTVLKHDHKNTLQSRLKIMITKMFLLFLSRMEFRVDMTVVVSVS